jgi:hypothetical protein
MILARPIKLGPEEVKRGLEAAKASSIQTGYEINIAAS